MAGDDGGGAMSILAESGDGALLALSFALLWQRRLPGMLAILALQGVVAALLAAQAGAWPLASIELVWGAAGLPWLLSRTPASPPWPATTVASLAAGAALGAVCLPIGAAGLGLAVSLLAGLLIALRPDPKVLVAGLGSLQAGVVAAGLASGTGGPSLLAAPVLPALGLVLCGAGAGFPVQPVRAVCRILSAAVTELAYADFVLCLLLTLFACALPWLGGMVPGPWRFDPVGILAAVLVSLTVCALRWPARVQHAAPLGIIVTLGAFVAVLADRPVLAWAGLAVAGTAAAAGSRHGRIAGIGLGLTLFGSITLHGATLPACVTMLVGLGCLAAVSPELTALALLFLLRLRGELGPLAGIDPLLIAAGLLALLLAVTGLTTTRPARLPVLATLGQAGVAVFALGLDVPQARFVAVLHLVLLVLTRLALDLAPEGGLPSTAALAGLAGLPPFGLFPSLALLLVATTAQAPLLLVPLVAGLAALGWPVLRAMPPGRWRLTPSPAWLPLAAALLIGLILPGPLGAGLHLVAEQLP